MTTYPSTARYELSSGGRYAARKSKSIVTYSQYVTRDGDSFERIAAKLFNDGTRYWEIADINPQVAFPEAIPTGTVIRIPL
jgi:nucleoid-associated protein YgaU